MDPDSVKIWHSQVGTKKNPYLSVFPLYTNTMPLYIRDMNIP